MAIASVGSAGTTISKTSGVDLVHTVTATIEAGNSAVLLYSGDNISTTTGDTDHLDISDSQGNTWTKIREHTYSEGVAGDGIMGAIFVSDELATELEVSVDTITVTADAALTAKALTVWEFTTGADLIVEQIQTGTADDLTPPSLSTSGMTSRSYLHVRLDASEDNGDSIFVQDADYTSFTAANTLGGALASNATVNGGFRIATLTGDTVVPTAGENRDRVAILVALYEDSATIENIVPATINSSSAVTATVTKVSNTGFQHVNSVIDGSDATLYQITGTISSNSLAVLGVLSVASSPPAPTITDTSGKGWVLISTVLQGNYRLSAYRASFNAGATITVSATFGTTQSACALSLEQIGTVNLSTPIAQVHTATA